MCWSCRKSFKCLKVLVHFFFLLFFNFTCLKVANVGFDWVLQKILLSSAHFFQAITRGCLVNLSLSRASAANPQLIYGAESSHFKKNMFFFERNYLHLLISLLGAYNFQVIFAGDFFGLCWFDFWFFGFFLMYPSSQTLPCVGWRRSRACQEMRSRNPSWGLWEQDRNLVMAVSVHIKFSLSRHVCILVSCKVNVSQVEFSSPQVWTCLPQEQIFMLTAPHCHNSLLTGTFQAEPE